MALQLKKEYDRASYCHIVVTLALIAYSLYDSLATTTTDWHFDCNVAFHLQLTLAYMMTCAYYWSNRHTNLNMVMIHMTVIMLLNCFVAASKSGTMLFSSAGVASFFGLKYLERLFLQLESLNRSRN